MIEKQKRLSDYPEILTTKDVAEILKVDEAMVLEMLESGDIPGKRLGPVWRVMKGKFLALFDEEQPIPSNVDNSKKIGEFVRQSMTELLQQGRLAEEEIELLKSPEYSKKVFGIHFPVIREYVDDPCKGISQQIADSKGYARYWKELVAGRYLITSQWHERHRSKFLNWLSRFA